MHAKYFVKLRILQFEKLLTSGSMKQKLALVTWHAGPENMRRNNKLAFCHTTLLGKILAKAV